MSDADKIMGLVPKDKYVLYTYYLLLGSAVAGIVLNVLGIIGVYLPLGALIGLVGLVGLIMGLVGYFGFKDQFNALDQAHLLYLVIIFAVFFVVGLVVGGSFYSSMGALMLVSFLINLGQALMLFTGYNSWKHGRAITKDNIKSEVQLALKRA